MDHRAPRLRGAASLGAAIAALPEVASLPEKEELSQQFARRIAAAGLARNRWHTLTDRELSASFGLARLPAARNAILAFMRSRASPSSAYSDTVDPGDTTSEKVSTVSAKSGATTSSSSTQDDKPTDASSSSEDLSTSSSPVQPPPLPPVVDSEFLSEDELGLVTLFCELTGATDMVAAVDVLRYFKWDIGAAAEAFLDEFNSCPNAVSKENNATTRTRPDVLAQYHARLDDASRRQQLRGQIRGRPSASVNLAPLSANEQDEEQPSEQQPRQNANVHCPSCQSRVVMDSDGHPASRFCVRCGEILPSDLVVGKHVDRTGDARPASGHLNSESTSSDEKLHRVRISGDKQTASQPSKTSDIMEHSANHHTTAPLACCESCGWSGDSSSDNVPRSAYCPKCGEPLVALDMKEEESVQAKRSGDSDSDDAISRGTLTPSHSSSESTGDDTDPLSEGDALNIAKLQAEFPSLSWEKIDAAVRKFRKFSSRNRESLSWDQFCELQRELVPRIGSESLFRRLLAKRMAQFGVTDGSDTPNLSAVDEDSLKEVSISMRDMLSLYDDFFVSERRALARLLAPECSSQAGHEVSEDEVYDMLKRFEEFDLEKNGVIDKDEFYHLKARLSRPDLSRILLQRRVDKEFEDVRSEQTSCSDSEPAQTSNRSFLRASQAGLTKDTFVNNFDTLFSPMTPMSPLSSSAAQAISTAASADLFDRLFHERTVPGILSAFQQLVESILPSEERGKDSGMDRIEELFDDLRSATSSHVGAQTIFNLLEEHRTKSDYSKAPTTSPRTDSFEGNLDDAHRMQLKKMHALVVGAGPGGLRAAIELRMCGVGKVTVIERRRQFTRNNVLLLWPMTVLDCKSLGVQQWHNAIDGPFCASYLPHVSIQSLQRALLKTALLVGVRVFIDSEFTYCKPPEQSTGDVAVYGHGRSSVRVRTANSSLCPGAPPPSAEHADWADIDVACDILVGADGGGGKYGDDSVLGFSKKKIPGPRNMIGITFNLQNTRTEQECCLREFGLTRYADQERFSRIEKTTGCNLENLVYYREHGHHYFVFTPMRKSLLETGVLRSSKQTTAELLDSSNVDDAKLGELCRRVAEDCGLPRDLKFATDFRNRPDRAIFDFSTMYQASELVRLIPDSGSGRLFAAIIGDALVDPFWPEGTGVNRVLQSVLNMCWYLKEWAAELAIQDDIDGSRSIPDEVCDALASAWKHSLVALTRCHFFKGNLERSSFVEPITKHGLDPATRFRPRL